MFTTSSVDACAASGGFVPLLLAVLVRELRNRGTQLRNRMPLGDRTTIAGGFGCFSLRGVLPVAAASSEAGTSIVIALTGRKTPDGFDTPLDDARALRGDPKSCVFPGPAEFGVGIVGMENSSRPITAHSKIGNSDFRGARFLMFPFSSQVKSPPLLASRVHSIGFL